MRNDEATAKIAKIKINSFIKKSSTFLLLLSFFFLTSSYFFQTFPYISLFVNNIPYLIYLVLHFLFFISQRARESDSININVNYIYIQRLRNYYFIMIMSIKYFNKQTKIIKRVNTCVKNTRNSNEKK